MITFQSILDDINVKKQELSKEYVDDPGFAFCQDYVSKNQIHKIEDLMEIDPWGYLTCSLYIQSERGFTIEECQEISDACKSIFGQLDIDDFNRILSIILVLGDHPNHEDYFQYITEPSKVRAGAILLKIRNETFPLAYLTKGDFPDVKAYDALKEIREIEQRRGGYPVLMKFLDEEVELSMKILAFVSQHKKMVFDRDNIINGEDANKYGKRVKERAAHSFYRTIYSYKGIKTEHDIITTFVQEEKKKKAVYEKSRKGQLFNYEQALSLLQEANRKDDIKNAREIIKRIPDIDLKKKVLQWIYEKNHQYHVQLEEKLQEISSHSMNHYFAILKRHRITMDISKVPTIMHHSMEEVEAILDKIPTEVFTQEHVIQILQTSDISTVQTIRKYFDLGFIRGATLCQNMDLFYVGGSKLKKLEESYRLLSSCGINQKLFVDSPQILWVDSSDFPQNMKYLRNYHLLKAIKTTSDYEFLLDSEMVNKIDQFVELGYYSFLEQNLSLLNYSKERINRLALLKVMNIPIEDIDDLFEVLDNNRFIVKDEKIDDYLLDVLPYKGPVQLGVSLEQLEGESSDGISLVLGNTIISLPKIKRNLLKGKSLEEAIFLGKRCSEEEYDQIVSSLSSSSKK